MKSNPKNGQRKTDNLGIIPSLHSGTISDFHYVPFSRGKTDNLGISNRR
jgi:hypothetical protein